MLQVHREAAIDSATHAHHSTRVPLHTTFVNKHNESSRSASKRQSLRRCQCERTYKKKYLSRWVPIPVFCPTRTYRAAQYEYLYSKHVIAWVCVRPRVLVCVNVSKENCAWKNRKIIVKTKPNKRNETKSAINNNSSINNCEIKYLTLEIVASWRCRFNQQRKNRCKPGETTEFPF